MLLAEGIDFFSLIEEELGLKPTYIVLGNVIEELLNIGRLNPYVARRIDFILGIIRKKCLIDNSKINIKDTDEALIEYALSSKAAVATNDRELRRKLRELGIPEIYLREESRRVGIEGLVV